ncbi:MAG: cytochrome c biogenesis protein [Candidatus Polarisedimenticolaceae bacterium]|nr:cytochrome c biogenesis protein [Candidatus Polarisedimenticolaceae bacterium]
MTTELETLISSTRVAAIVIIGFAILFSMFGHRRSTTYSLLSFLLLITIFFATRAYLKEFFPFTDKIESFATLSVLIVVCAMIYREKIANKEFTTLLVLAFSSLAATLIFEDKLHYPTAYLRTIWYPLHVPLSFAAYALWFLAGIDALYSTRKLKSIDPALADRPLITELNRNGFILFSFAMLFGGIWGYLAWGAYFMWDSKLLWSVILWLYYGNLLHIDALPRFRHWKVPLYTIGMALILITFIGTGFFTRSIHKF